MKKIKILPLKEGIKQGIASPTKEFVFKATTQNAFQVTGVIRGLQSEQLLVKTSSLPFKEDLHRHVNIDSVLELQFENGFTCKVLIYFLSHSEDSYTKVVVLREEPSDGYLVIHRIDAGVKELG